MTRQRIACKQAQPPNRARKFRKKRPTLLSDQGTLFTSFSRIIVTSRSCSGAIVGDSCLIPVRVNARYCHKVYHEHRHR